MRTTLLAALGVCAAAIAGAAIGLSDPPEATPEASRPPIVQWYGNDSRIQQRRWELITSAERWRALWEEHRAEGVDRAVQGWVQPPEIDFARYAAVALFRGRTINNNGERADAVFVRDGATVIRFDSVSFQTASLDGPDHGEPTVPYGIWLVERSERPILIEENVQGLIGGPAVWKRVHVLPAAG